VNRPWAALGIGLVFVVALSTGTVLLVAYAMAIGSMLLPVGVLLRRAFRRYREGADPTKSPLTPFSEGSEIDGKAA